MFFFYEPIYSIKIDIAMQIADWADIFVMKL